MANLLLVESPAKIKKIAGFLSNTGKDWIVEATRGHIRDLPDTTLGIDVQKDFAIEYVTLKDKKAVVARLRKLMQTADALYLATDPDREGESISWHVLQELKSVVKNKPVYRVTFTSITRQAVLQAVANPRKLDNSLIEAQQTRRVVDRLVGYLVSPLACKVLNTRVSAGRVQSVALRCVVDREQEIETFKPVQYWTLDVKLKTPTDADVVAQLTMVRGSKAALSQRDQVDKLMVGLRGAAFWVGNVNQITKPRRPLPPFTTSSLQQAASKALGLSPEETMRVAQVLYEEGYITYMRTDSVAVAPEAQSSARMYIEQHYGATYVPGSAQVYTTKNENAQEAHEAIRPTDLNVLASSLTAGNGANVYDLIWKRFVASQMADARYNVGVAQILTGATVQTPYPLEFQAKGRALIFDGFLRVYQEALDEGEEPELDSVLPPLTPRQALSFVQWLPEEHTTKAPPRYTEASLIQTLEKRGIGRPSTFATMVKTIKEKGYTKLQKKQLVPTDAGKTLCKFLVERFPVVFDYDYTASLEGELDQIASNKSTRLSVLRTFWNEKLSPALGRVAAELTSANVSSGATHQPANAQPVVLTPAKKVG